MVNSIMTMLEKENYIAGSTAPHWSHGASLVAMRFSGHKTICSSHHTLLVARCFDGCTPQSSLLVQNYEELNDLFTSAYLISLSVNLKIIICGTFQNVATVDHICVWKLAGTHNGVPVVIFRFLNKCQLCLILSQGKVFE